MKLKKLFITLIVLVVSLFYISEINTTYKFGIDIKDYNKTAKYGEMLNKEPKYLALNNNINKYSWNTPLRLPNSNIKIRIEHLVVANDVDIALIPKIKDKKNFLTVIEYLKGKVISIDVKNSVDGYPLKQKEVYAYVKSAKKKRNFDVIEIGNNHLNQKDYVAIGFVFASHKKLKTSFLGIQKYQFDKAYQKIVIRYFDNQNNIQKQEYIFELKWYYHLTGYDKLITIT